MPDCNCLIWRQVNHGLSCKKAVDLTLGAKLGAEDLLVDDCKLGLHRSILFALHWLISVTI